jgi:hypothetical protein
MPGATLLLPARDAFAGRAVPEGVAMALGRGDRSEGAPGRRAQLQRQFALVPAGWPVAALTRGADAGDADSAQWLRADPAWIRPDINGARLFAAGEGLRLGPEDAAALLPALQPMFGDAGMPIDAPHPSRWYLRLALGARVPSFPEPGEALGADLGDAIVDGAEDATTRRWRALLSEAQVVLHNHPWNARRAEAGKPPVNSLWFWGGGALPDRVATRFTGVASDDALLRGLGTRAGCVVQALPTGFAVPAAGDALLDAGAAADVEPLFAQWVVPALQALRRGALEALTLDFADGVRFELRAGQRWRVWRRPLRAIP